MSRRVGRFGLGFGGLFSAEVAVGLGRLAEPGRGWENGRAREGRGPRERAQTVASTLVSLHGCSFWVAFRRADSFNRGRVTKV